MGVMDTTTLNLPVILPEDSRECERCMAELQDRLRGLRGVETVGVDRDRALLNVRLDTGLISLARLESVAKHSGVAIARRFRHEMVELQGLDCADCVTVIEHGLRRLPGMLTVSVNYAASRVWVEYDRDKVGRQEIIQRIRALGYQVRETHEGGHGHRRELALALLAGLLTGFGWLAGRGGLPPLAGTLLYVAAYITGGWFTLRGALRGLRTRRIDIDLLMLLASVGAAVLNRWAEGAVLLLLFSLGHALEHYAMARARRAIRAILRLAPQQATVLREGREELTSVEAVEPGMFILVRPGDRIPLDGDVVEGSSMVNQAAITGESVPVAKKPESRVFAGTVSTDGALTIRVTRKSQDSTLAKIAQLVQEAQAQKSPTQRVTERIARYLVPGVLAGSALTLLSAPILGIPFAQAFYRAMILLVAASPCALAIATPAAVLSALARAAMTGVLVKGGTALEEAGTVRVMALDKTGTLTLGEPQVTDVVAFGTPEDDILRIAASVESRSEHALGRAIVQAARDRSLDFPTATDVRAVPGKGIVGAVNGTQVAIGTIELFQERGISLPQEARGAMERLQQAGKTAVVLARQGQVVGLIAMADAPRKEARSALDRLKRLGLKRLIMLTGDNAVAAQAIGSGLGIDEVQADLLPHEKTEAVKALRAKYGEIVMVGDGVNDAPALAAATVGIAMGASGTDVALETADIALMTDNLGHLPYALGLSRATRRVVLQNLTVSLTVIGLLVITSLIGFMTLPLAVSLHEGSTLLVTLNGLRLLTYNA